MIIVYADIILPLLVLLLHIGRHLLTSGVLLMQHSPVLPSRVSECNKNASIVLFIQIEWLKTFRLNSTARRKLIVIILTMMWCDKIWGLELNLLLAGCLFGYKDLNLSHNWVCSCFKSPPDDEILSNLCPAITTNQLRCCCCFCCCLEHN